MQLFHPWHSSGKKHFNQPPTNQHSPCLQPRQSPPVPLPVAPNYLFHPPIPFPSRTCPHSPHPSPHHRVRPSLLSQCTWCGTAAHRLASHLCSHWMSPPTRSLGPHWTPSPTQPPCPPLLAPPNISLPLPGPPDPDASLLLLEIIDLIVLPLPMFSPGTGKSFDLPNQQLPLNPPALVPDPTLKDPVSQINKIYYDLVFPIKVRGVLDAMVIQCL